MHKLFILTIFVLIPFSLSGMEEMPKDTTLHYACDLFEGNVKEIQDLLKEGFDANEPGASKNTPLGTLAARLQYCIKCKTNNMRFFWVPELTSFEGAVKILLKHGADINREKKNYLLSPEKSNYELIKSCMPKLDDIIEKVEFEKKPAVLKQQNRANQSINISGVESKLHKEILSARCPNLLLLN
jgi:ankyrin repeat protein